MLARGIRVGKDRVQKLMQLHGIRAKGKRRFTVTTDSKHDLPISPNLLDRQFTVAEPDKVWAGDISERMPAMIETLLTSQRPDYGVPPCGWLPLGNPGVVMPCPGGRVWRGDQTVAWLPILEPLVDHNTVGSIEVVLGVGPES